MKKQNKAREWNGKEYHEYDLPSGAIKYTNNMDEVISCAKCGKRIAYGDCYTSRNIHDDVGFGYAVCPECHEAEYR